MPLSQDEKNAKALREQIAKIPENKRCADCTAKGPVYANTTFNTFICTSCSGIHREFNHRVKSISMASFKPEEMKGLLEGGNAIAREKWLAKWKPSDFPEPDPGDPDKLRQFIRMKYIDKKWVAHDSPKEQTIKHNKPKVTDSHLPRAEPITNLLGNDLPPMTIGNRAQQHSGPSSKQSSNEGWANFDDSNWKKTETITQNNNTSFFDTPIAPQNQASNGLEGLLFPSQEEAKRIEQEKLAKQHEELNKKKNYDLVSQLGSLYQQQAAINQQQQMMMMQQQMMKMAQGMQGLTPQQQQMYYQQMMMQMGGMGMPGAMPGIMPGSMPGAIPGAMPGQMPVGVPFSNPQNSIPFGTQPTATPFVMSTSPTGGNVFTEPVKPAEPAKPDPFAALSPFNGGNPKSNVNAAPKKPTESPSSNQMGDFFGSTTSIIQQQELNPFGMSQPAHIPQPAKQDDFNPFF